MSVTSGVGIGSTIGSVIPGIGTAAGATIGGIIDSLSGLFGKPDCPSKQGGAKQTSIMMEWAKTQGVDVDNTTDPTLTAWLKQGVQIGQGTCKKGWDNSYESWRNYYLTNIKPQNTNTANIIASISSNSTLMYVIITGIAVFFFLGKK